MKLMLKSIFLGLALLFAGGIESALAQAPTIGRAGKDSDATHSEFTVAEYFFRQFIQAGGINTCDPNKLAEVFGPNATLWLEHFSGKPKSQSELKEMANAFAGMVMLVHRKIDAQGVRSCTVQFAQNPTLSGDVRALTYPEVSRVLELCRLEEPRAGYHGEVFAVLTPCHKGSRENLIRFNFVNGSLTDIFVSGGN